MQYSYSNIEFTDSGGSLQTENMSLSLLELFLLILIILSVTSSPDVNVSNIAEDKFLYTAIKTAQLSLG